MTRVPAQALAALMERALARRGVPAEHRRLVSGGLIEASLRGIDTHGVRLFPVYVAELDGGRSRPRPRLAWRRGGRGALTLDADGALGLVAGSLAADAAVRLARANGVGAVAVRDSNHFGPASCYTLRMARSGALGLTFSNSDALVAPHGGVRPFVGTNPLSLAVAGAGDELFCLDMATSQVSYSKLKARRARGEPIEPGWAVDAAGRDVTEGAGEVSALKPLGGYKGEGLGLAIEILCTLLTGMPFDHQLSHLYAEPYDAPRRIGHLMVALDLEAFVDPPGFRRRLGELLRLVRGQEAAPGGQDGRNNRVLAPGDLEREAERERSEHGIPLAPDELEALRRIDAETPDPADRAGL